MSDARSRKRFLLVLVLAITATFLAMVRSFLLAILLAAILSALAAPLYARLERLVRGRRGLASLLTLLLLLVLGVAPLLGLVGVVTAEAFRVTASARPWVEQQLAQPDLLMERLRGLPFADALLPYRAEILTKAGELVGRLGTLLMQSLSAATRGTLGFFLQLGFVFYAMYFFLMEGRGILARLREHLPLDDADAQRLLDRFVSVTRAILRGILVIGILQGTLAGAGLAAAGIEGAVFWGVVMVVLSILPVIGTALVWIPAVILLFLEGRVLASVLLAVWCGAVVGSIDNFLRPRLIGRDTKMHELLVFFGTLGGISLFGAVGLLLGPIVAALFVTVWEIWGMREGSGAVSSAAAGSGPTARISDRGRAPSPAPIPRRECGSCRGRPRRRRIPSGRPGTRSRPP